MQEDVAETMIDMLVGAVEALDIGDPLDYATDVGPVIDSEARERLEAHKARMRTQARKLVDLPLPDACTAGTYVAPAVYEIDSAGRCGRRCSAPSCTWCATRAVTSTA